MSSADGVWKIGENKILEGRIWFFVNFWYGRGIGVGVNLYEILINIGYK